ncbi:MAG: type I phosphomannose isomerase catalytic subunit [Steroidobacteraceae bacterium]
MNQIPLYPLRFEPIYQYRPWGGRRLTTLISAVLPGNDPVGESWLLSDRDDHSSVIANGELKGRTLGEILNQWPEQLLGKRALPFRRFPLLLKFLDVRGSLSVQVHPSDAQTAYLPAGESGKTEAWVVMATGTEGRIYAGLAPDTSVITMREALAAGAVVDQLSSFAPRAGDGIFISAGTVHSLRDVVVFEVQENSDVTLRLYDWNQMDGKTHQRRPLQVEEALACIDFSQGIISPVVPVVEAKEPLLRERLFDCPQFELWRLRCETSFTVGEVGSPRVLVCVGGEGDVTYDGAGYYFGRGDVLLLPAVVGACVCQPHSSISLLEISLPSGSMKQ